MYKIINVTKIREKMKTLTNVRRDNPYLIVKNGVPKTVLVNFLDWQEVEEGRKSKSGNLAKNYDDFMTKIRGKVDAGRKFTRDELNER